MFEYLRPFIAPVLTPFIGSFIVWLNVRYHIVYTPEQVDKINQAAVTAVLLIVSTAASISGALKVALNKKLNPANAATSQLASAGKQANEDEKVLQAAVKTAELKAQEGEPK